MTPYTKSSSEEIILKMTKICSGFVFFVCLVVVPSVQSIWPFWRPLPSNPNDPSYKSKYGLFNVNPYIGFLSSFLNHNLIIYLLGGNYNNSVQGADNLITLMVEMKIL